MREVKAITSFIMVAMFIVLACGDGGTGNVLVQSITVEGNNITDGGTSQLTVTITPPNATDKRVTWSVSNLSKATVSESGLLTAVANGTVNVIATALDASGVFGQLEINISGVGTSTPPLEGTIVSTSQELLNAVANASAGDKIYVHGGDYTFTSTIKLTHSGTDGNVISLLAHPDDATRPKFDFSSMAESSSNRGINVQGNYWHIKGIDIFSAGDNGMNITGDNNIIEFCTFSENADSGLQLDGGAENNLILNCDSYYNADAAIENADGFACKLDVGSGNKFIGCRAWQNLDDGWDGYLRGADNVTTYYENCWAFKNGMLKNGTVSGGDGNGFKTGGSDDKQLKHNASYKNCIAAGNVADGVDHNSNRGDITIYNSSTYSNGRNINFSSTNSANQLTIKNSLSVLGGSGDSYQATTTNITNNSWQNGLSATSEDFVSVDMSLLTSPRKADGSLPDIDFLKLVSGSDLINKGVDVGISFKGTAPDLGAFELE